jgi:hypothetical protein
MPQTRLALTLGGVGGASGARDNSDDVDCRAPPLSLKRQTIVSLLGITLSVAFFLAISAMMGGSEKAFIKRLVV